MSGPVALTRTVPYGHHVFVLSDLDLTGDGPTPALERLTHFLRDTDDAAIVIIAGNFFRPGDRPLGGVIDDVLRLAPDFGRALAAFSGPHREFIVLPGTHDGGLATDGAATARLTALGVVVAERVTLELEAAEGTQRVVVEAATSSESADTDHVAGLEGAHLDDAMARPRFLTSRTLYRRFGFALWLGLAAVVGFDLFNSVTKAIGVVTDRHYRIHAPHTHTVAGNVLLNLLLVVFIEALIVVFVTAAVRRRFGLRRTDDRALYSEPLANTMLDADDALTRARTCVSHGAAGLLVGGAARPALAYLDDGFCASPGPSRQVTTEHDAVFGLPSVFVDVHRFSYVSLEVGATVQVQLLGSQALDGDITVLERLVMRAPVQPGLPETESVVGSWPSGQPFPLQPERLVAARRQRSIRRWASGLLLIDGLINVVVTASPPLRTRLHLVLKYLPLGVAQSAAVVTALAGVAMIMLARGVRRGQRRAWYVAELALALTVIAHVARAGSLASSVVAAAIFVFLLLQRRHFNAMTDRTSLPAIFPRVLTVAGLAVAAATLGVEAAARGHADNVLPSWPTVVVACLERLVGIYVINLPDRVSDFVDPVLLTIGVALFISLLYAITRPVVDRRLSQHATSAERRLSELRARDIVRRHGRGTLDYFALRDDKQFFFLRDSLVAYAVYGGVALISPDPIGPEAERTEIFSAFRAFAEGRGWTIAVMGAAAEWLPIYHAAGFHSLYLGDEAIVDCQTFSLEGGKMKGLRQACGRLARHGYTVEFYDPATIDPSHVTGVLELVAMMRRGEDERGFSMMLGRLFDPKDKGLLLTIVRGPDGRPAAACQFVPSPAINGYSLDLMRRDPGDHPNGLIDYALCSTIAHLREQGSSGLSLNFAAFRGVLDGERGEGTWTRVERWTLNRLSGVLPIASLWTFNAKYHPRWLPRHIVYPALESFVPVVGAILRAESLTEIPVLGRFLANDPSNRPGTVVPPTVLAAAKAADQAADADSGEPSSDSAR